MDSRVDCVAIIGVGLIGGSFGMALKKRGLANRVIGVGRNPERLKMAVELGAVDEWTTDLAAGVRDADLIYVSTPVGMELDFIRSAAKHAKPGCVITDAGSTKAEICRGVDGPRFVGGHPMAGSEETGVEAANPALFINAAYVLTPTKRTNPDALALVRGLAEAVGSRVIVMDPETHDRCVAVISHLPHLLAIALVSLAEDRSTRDPQVLELIAGSFRDMTRVAGSSPELWRDICMTNADAIKEAAVRFQSLLDEGVKLVESGDAPAFEEWFRHGKDFRQSLITHHSSLITIAIDGPAGAGKTTIAREVARRLGLKYVDTGAMYRAVAWKSLEEGIPLSDEKAIIEMAGKMDIDFADTRIFVDGTDVSEAIRSPEVTRLSSPVSAISGVRRVLVAQQKKLAGDGGVVMEGRDIGSVVLPNAECKIFLTASVDERANRRYLEMKAAGMQVDIEALKKDIEERDIRDSTRSDSPLTQVPDAIVIDTDNLTIEEVIERVIALTRD